MPATLDPPKALSMRREDRELLKTQGEIEALICAGMSRFEQEYMGRGPKVISANLIGDLLVVRLQGVLTAAEKHLVTTLSIEKGRELLKQVRSHLIETARPALDAMVLAATGVNVLSMHHDISTRTGEEVVIFTLAEAPQFRLTKLFTTRCDISIDKQLREDVHSHRPVATGNPAGTSTST